MSLSFGGGLFNSPPDFMVTYNWREISSSTGFVLFDGLNAVDSTGSNYILLANSSIDSFTSSNLLTGSSGSVVSTTVTGNSSQSADLDFDLSPFLLPVNIKGQGVLRIGLSDNVGDGTAVTNTFVVALLRKWDGSTETEIVSVQSATATIGDTSYRVITMKFTIPLTHFKVGEQLRLTIRVTTGDNVVYRIGHDPGDTAQGYLTAGNSRLLLALPLKVEVMK